MVGYGTAEALVTVTAAEVAGAAALEETTTGPWPSGTAADVVAATAEAAAVDGDDPEPEPAVATHSHTALAEA